MIRKLPSASSWPLAVLLIALTNSPGQAQRLTGVGLAEVLSAYGPIVQLGSALPHQRAAAQAQLRAVGADAFDRLQFGQGSCDPEIAMTCRRLLRQIDPQSRLMEACATLHGYTQLDFLGKSKLLIQLSREGTADSLRGLCRVARYETDEFLSRCAAVEFILSSQRTDVDLVAIARCETGTSGRIASRWIHAFCTSRLNPQQLETYWDPLIDELVGNTEISESIASEHVFLTRRLLQWYSDQLLASQRHIAAERIADCLVEHVSRHPQRMIDSVDWLMQRQFDRQVTTLANRCPERFQEDGRLIYRQAEISRRRGQWWSAMSLAWRASAAIGPDPQSHLECALQLQRDGLLNWAQLEYAQVLSDRTADELTVLQCRCLFAEALHLQGNDLAAAQMLEAAIAQFSEADLAGSARVLVGESSELQARRHLFMAAYWQSQGDLLGTRQSLLSGLALAPNDTDLLIALYQLPATGPQWVTGVGELVDRALSQIRSELTELQNELPEGAAAAAFNERLLADALNRYAWLAVNTNGDLELAQDYSRRAVGISPATAAFLDTLARCHYHQGDWQQAIAWQRRAITQQPGNRRLAVTLSQYEQALAFAELTKIWR